MEEKNKSNGTIDLNQLIAEREAVIQRLQGEIRERSIEAERFIGELRLLRAMREGGYSVTTAPEGTPVGRTEEAEQAGQAKGEPSPAAA
jgi:hypothetical protein